MVEGDGEARGGGGDVVVAACGVARGEAYADGSWRVRAEDIGVDVPAAEEEEAAVAADSAAASNGGVEEATTGLFERLRKKCIIILI